MLRALTFSVDGGFLTASPYVLFLLISKKFDYQPRAEIIITEKQASTFGNNAELFEQQCEDWVRVTQTHILKENTSDPRLECTGWLQAPLLSPFIISCVLL